MARFDYNPLTNQLDLVDSPAGYINGVVDDPTLLPVTLGTPALDSVYLAKAGSGLWLISRKPAGLYCRTANSGVAADWTYLGAFPEVNADGNWELYNTADPTKELKFSLSGITTGTTRTLTVPDASGTIATTAQSADMEITDNTKGIILKSPNNSRWRITINDDGTLARAALALMTLLAFAASGMAQVRDMVTDTNGTVITGRTNTLTFTNPATFSGTLTATGNVTMSGTANTAPSQTASSASSLMTRDLGDVRYGEAVRAGVVGVALTTNNTTLEDIAGLSIPLAVGLHQITAQVYFVANAAAGSKMAMTFSGSGTPSGQRQTTTTSVVQAVAIGSFASTSSATANVVNHFRIYTINVTAAGTLQVQGAQNVAGSNNITATGFLKAERL